MKTTGILTEVKNYLSDKIENDYTEKQILEQLQQHGCISGMVGELIYYSDTVKFYDKHKKEIISLIEDYCNQTGQTLKGFLMGANNFPLDKNEIEKESFVTGINGLIRKNKDVEDQIKNWLTWFGFEEVAYRYYSEKYEQ
jgi:hypothetical protein